MIYDVQVRCFLNTGSLNGKLLQHYNFMEEIPTSLSSFLSEESYPKVTISSLLQRFRCSLHVAFVVNQQAEEIRAVGAQIRSCVPMTHVIVTLSVFCFVLRVSTSRV